MIGYNTRTLPSFVGDLMIWFHANMNGWQKFNYKRLLSKYIDIGNGKLRCFTLSDAGEAIAADLGKSGGVA